MNYPESWKLSRTASERDAIVEFLEWAAREKSAHLCLHPLAGDSNQFHPLHTTAQALAHEFLGIDEAKLEAERRAMLEAIRG